jgi:hypothetical protein
MNFQDVTSYLKEHRGRGRRRCNLIFWGMNEKEQQKQNDEVGQEVSEGDREDGEDEGVFW